MASSKRCASSGLISSACGMDGELSEGILSSDWEGVSGDGSDGSLVSVCCWEESDSCG